MNQLPEKRERDLTTRELLQEGAEYEESGRLAVTGEQIDKAKRQMEVEQMAKSLSAMFTEEQLRLITWSLGRGYDVMGQKAQAAQQRGEQFPEEERRTKMELWLLAVRFLDVESLLARWKEEEAMKKTK